MSKTIKPFVSGKKDRKPLGFRRAVGNFLILLSLAFTAYIAAVMIFKIATVQLKQNYIIMLGVELAVCAVIVVLCFDIRTGFLTKAHNGFLKFIGWIIRVIFIALTLFVLAVTAYTVANSFGDATPKAKNAVVLGMALEDGKPNSDLISRVETAVKYAGENPEATLIASGGNGSENVKSEAEVMKELLTERGVEPSRIVTEDSSSDTRGNFENTAKLIDPTEPLVIITSSYHMQRAVDTAKSAGFTEVLKCPAPADPLFYGVNLVWEVIGTARRLVTGK